MPAGSSFGHCTPKTPTWFYLLVLFSKEHCLQTVADHLATAGDWGAIYATGHGWVRSLLLPLSGMKKEPTEIGSQVDNAAAHPDRDRLGPVACAQLFHEVLDMNFHGFF